MIIKALFAEDMLALYAIVSRRFSYRAIAITYFGYLAINRFLIAKPTHIFLLRCNCNIDLVINVKFVTVLAIPKCALWVLVILIFNIMLCGGCFLVAPLSDLLEKGFVAAYLFKTTFDFREVAYS